MCLLPAVGKGGVISSKAPGVVCLTVDNALLLPIDPLNADNFRKFSSQTCCSAGMWAPAGHMLIHPSVQAIMSGIPLMPQICTVVL